MKKYFFSFVLQIGLKFAQAWFEGCDYQNNLTTSIFYVINSNYPSKYQSGSSCKWFLTAPTGYTIDLQCTYNLDAPLTDCQSQRLYVSRDGDRSLSYSDYFCGYSTLSIVSVGNELTVGYTSNAGGSGWIYCEAKAVLTTQDNCQCGWSKSARIIGGEYAQPNEYVSMAALVDITQYNNSDGAIFCGAAIINENYALTAAHCFNTNRAISVVYLLVGDHDTTRGDDTPYASLYGTRRIIKHANYIPTSDNQNNDIALLQTVNEIKWKRTIGPACLPYIYNGYETYFDGFPLVVLGWGATEFAGPKSVILKKTSLTVVDSSTCNKTYSDINSGKICAFSKGTDSCQGDSGGSLYWNYGNRKYTVGIVSYAKDCASIYPSVNTRVTFYLNWIEQQLPGVFFCRK